MSSISIQHYVEGSLADANSVALCDATNTFGIRNVTSGVTEVAPTGLLSSISPGVYSYDTSFIPPGMYEAVWKLINGGGIEYHTHVFRIDAIEVATNGCMLMEIEEEVCARIGPYYNLEVESGGGLAAVIPGLGTDLDTDEYSDLYILRRGLFRDSREAIVGFPASDRIRRVTNFIPTTGTIVPDRVWSSSPVNGELIELTYLHPDTIRRATLSGLKRCYSLDTVSISPTATATERNLTASIPWLRRTTQLRDVGSVPPSSLNQIPLRVDWVKAITKQGAIYAQMQPDPYPSTIIVTAMRPMHTLVNGVTSLTGPNDDSDILAVDLSYAASAAVIECWRYAKPLLAPQALAGLALTQKDAANDFTTQSKKNLKMLPEISRTSDPLGFRVMELV